MALLTPQGRTTAHERCMEYLSRAFQTCLKEHRSCTVADDTDWIPSRLLDLQPALSTLDSVALVERYSVYPAAASPIRYITLSHMWGGCQPLVLTKATREDMMRGIRTSLLPQCYQDAIKVVRQLGMRYMWIDSLW